MTITPQNDEITFGQFLNKIKNTIKYVKSKWVIVIAFSLLGALLGLAYSINKKITYTAVSTFVLEENSKAGALGQYAGLASLAGVDISGGGGGLFQGDNILELYKSRLMIEKTLLTEAEFNNKKQLLIDRYISFNDLLNKWKTKDHIDHITFEGDPSKFNRCQDSIITDIVDKFNKTALTVVKLDKKLSIIVVQFSTKDELFSKEFTKKLVETVNDFYVQTKTKKSTQNVLILQHQADSVRNVLNASLSGVASAIDAAPNANPLLLTLRVPSQKKQIDVQASTAVYSEIVKNLEISKISLRQEIPLIQVIDQPVLPLENDHVGKLKGIVYGFILAGLTTVLFILFKKLLRSVSE